MNNNYNNGKKLNKDWKVESKLIFHLIIMEMVINNNPIKVQ